MDNHRILDDTDRLILNILQTNARVANTEVAREVGLAPSAILERIRKLEDRGFIRGYHARIEPKPLGAGLLAFVFVRTDDRANEPETARRLGEIPEVQEVHNIAGEDCFLVKARVADTEALGLLLRDKIGAVKAVRSTRTTIVLETLKESGAIPIGAVHGRDARKTRKGGRR
jgi:Lrp/AsnC family leucine-responsive transcriptional regulator